MINVSGVFKSFDGFLSLNNLSLHVPRGCVYGLIGPNGAGKTTIIKHICGVMRPDRGSVTIDGESVYENNSIKSKLCYISDEIFSFGTYSIAEMADFYRSIYHGWNEARFKSLGEIFKIDPKRRMRRLSKGMQKQAAFWLGICTMPDVMILDEPVDGLDPVMRRNVWRLIMQDVAERSMTVLISSHNLRELEDVCDHIGILHNGKVIIERELDDAKSSLHKLQVAFAGGSIPKELEKLDILHRESYGSINALIIRGSKDEILNSISALNPLISDILPLTLEEVFIYELGGIGYELENVIL